MRGDFSRTTHRPNRHYSRVLLQQGRVLLDADWNEQVEIQLQATRTMMADLVGPHGGPASALAFEVRAELSDSNAVVLTIAPSERGDVKQGLLRTRAGGRYYVEGILVEQLEPATIETGLPAADGLALLVYLEVWEQAVTWIEENKPFKQRSMRDIGLGGPDTCSRSQVRWALRTLDVSKLFREQKLVQSQRAMPWAINRPLRMRAALTKQDIGAGDPCRDTAQARYRGPENRLYRVEIHAASESEVTFKWSRENGSVVFPVDVGAGTTFTEGELTLALGLPADPRFGLVEGNIVELVTQSLDAGGQAGPLLEVVGIADDARSVRLKPLGSAQPQKLEGWALLRRWDQPLDPRRENGSPAKLIDGAIRVDLGDRFMLEDGIYVQFGREELDAKIKEIKDVRELKDIKAEAEREKLRVNAVRAEGDAVRETDAQVEVRDEAPRAVGQFADLPCRVGDYWLIPARTIPSDIEWPSDGFELAHGIPHHYAPLAIVQAELGSPNSEDFGLVLTVRDLRFRFEPLAHPIGDK